MAATTPPAQSGRIDAADIDLADIDRYKRHGMPWAEWKQLREQAPVFWHEAASSPPFWAVTRHADVHEVHSRPDIFIKSWANPTSPIIYTRTT